MMCTVRNLGTVTTYLDNWRLGRLTPFRETSSMDSQVINVTLKPQIQENHHGVRFPNTFIAG
jgi:hypothetical protein